MRRASSFKCPVTTALGRFFAYKVRYRAQVRGRREGDREVGRTLAMRDRAASPRLRLSWQGGMLPATNIRTQVAQSAPGRLRSIRSRAEGAREEHRLRRSLGR